MEVGIGREASCGKGAEDVLDAWIVMLLVYTHLSEVFNGGILFISSKSFSP